MKRELILTIVTEFYEKAIHDFLIGYHFRVIPDFMTHLPRIAAFWELQLTGSCPKEFLPFDLLMKHRPLGIMSGEVGRWVLLFKEVLDAHASELSESEMKRWKDKVDHFAEILKKDIKKPS